MRFVEEQFWLCFGFVWLCGWKWLFYCS